MKDSRIRIDDANHPTQCVDYLENCTKNPFMDHSCRRRGPQVQMCSGALLGLLRGPDRPFPEHSLGLSVQHSHTHKGEEGLRISLRVQRPSLSLSMIPMGLNQKERCFGEGERELIFGSSVSFGGTNDPRHHQHLVTSREGD